MTADRTPLTRLANPALIEQCLLNAVSEYRRLLHKRSKARKERAEFEQADPEPDSYYWRAWKRRAENHFADYETSVGAFEYHHPGIADLLAFRDEQNLAARR